MSVRLISPTGQIVDAEPGDVPVLLASGYAADDAHQRAQRAVDAGVQANLSQGLTALDEFNAATTLGITDLIGRAGDDGADYAAHRSASREAFPITAAVANIGGSLVSPAGAVGKLAGSAVRGTSAAAKIARAGVAGGTEGAVLNIGSGVSELALSKDPITLEHAASVLSSKAAMGFGIGGLAGGLGKVTELGIARARGVIDDFANGRSKITAADDVVAERAAIVDEIKSFRRSIKDEGQFHTVDKLKMPARDGKMSAGELARANVKYENKLAGMLDNPKDLAARPQKALEALRGLENGQQQLLNHADDLRAAYQVDGRSGARAAALDKTQSLLERNQALQKRIEGFIEATSPQAAKPRGMAEDLLMGASYGVAADAVNDLADGSPLAGAAKLAAPFLGARFSKLVGEQVFGRVNKATGASMARTKAAVDSFMNVSSKVAKLAPPLATRVLTQVRFGPDDGKETRSLPDAFRARSREVSALVEPGPDGKLMMRPGERAKIASSLAPVAVRDPVAADRIESVKARGIEFLADKLPKRPDVGGVPVGPDRWRPSDFEMRRWARYVSAVEDPGGVEERLADGVITMEDVEAFKAVYPARMAAITTEIISRLPDLRKDLPYRKKLALSMFTGVPVVAAMDPKIMSVLQSQYDEEVEDEPGPTAKPQFGSVKAPDPTPSQERVG